MDLYAYSQIEILEDILKEINVEIRRLRGLRLMAKEEVVSKEKIEEIIKSQKVSAVEQWLKQHEWDCWSSSKDNKWHPAFKEKKVIRTCGDEEWTDYEVVDYDFSKIHGKDRKELKFKFKKIEREVKAEFNMFNKFVGTNTLYVHARQGGGNRDWYGMDKIAKHPRWLGDVDDCYDGTYCDIYFDLNGIDVEKFIKEIKEEVSE